MTVLKSRTGRVLGVDFGDVRTGLAVSDETRFLASGIGYVKVGGIVKTADRVAEAVMENDAVAVIVGHPVNMNGTIGPRAERAEEFAGLLRERLPEVEVLMYDERMTTMAAARYLTETNTHGSKRKNCIDTLSAQIILQNYLDMEKNAVKG